MHLQYTMSSMFDWEVRRLGMRDTLRHGTITVSGFGYFKKNCRFLWGKKCFKDKFRKYSTLYLYVIEQIFPTLYGFRGDAAQWNRSLPLVVYIKPKPFCVIFSLYSVSATLLIIRINGWRGFTYDVYEKLNARWHRMNAKAGFKHDMTVLVHNKKV